MKLFKLTLLAITTALFLQGCDDDDDGSSTTPPDQSDIKAEILGVWTGNDTDDELLTIAFLDDGTYIHLEANERPEIAKMQSLRQVVTNSEGGMEWGKYTIDDDTGELTTTPVFDNNGSAGLSDSITRYARVSDGTLTLEIDENDDGIIGSDEVFSFSETKSEGLLGAWGSDDIDEGLLGVAFFEDGTYVHVQVDEEDRSINNPKNGMEWGTYVIDDVTGSLTTTQLFDNNGESGLSDPLVRYARIVNGKLIIEVDEDKNGTIDNDEIFGFSKLTADNNPTDQVDSKDLLGLWENKDTDNELLTLAFYDDGTYLHVEVDEEIPYDTSNDELSGFEWGKYTLNNRTGALTIVPISDNNGDTGLSDPDMLPDPRNHYLSLSGDTLTLKVDENQNGVIDDNESYHFSRAKSENELGVWTNIDANNENELLTFAFFEDGTLAHIEVDEKPPFDSTDSDPKQSGMTWSGYTINNQGELTMGSRIFSSPGDTGLYGSPYISINVSGDNLILVIDESEQDENEDLRTYNFKRH
ncbi:hypothetical protein [Psychrobacter sp. M13]|uniref:hypothetical protein n=1 Tax=Psychrobacter sp. M13 TaxID=3067275 RepID=UPI00273C7F27|nr:hypothetical protein [Psychrobacter sp. M13]WLP95022.1 hypothetical protein Q9G97_02590 [Psychrobacter sp. M13]